jgi:hypothetical protein
MRRRKIEGKEEKEETKIDKNYDELYTSTDVSSAPRGHLARPIH